MHINTYYSSSYLSIDDVHISIKLPTVVRNLKVAAVSLGNGYVALSFCDGQTLSMLLVYNARTS